MMVDRVFGIYSYYLRFVFMLLAGWPVVLVWQTAKTVVFAPFMFLFGYYPIPTFESIRNYGDFNPLAVDVGEIPLPRIGNARVIPLYVLLPIGYLGLFLLYNTTVILVWTSGITLTIGTNSIQELRNTSRGVR